MQPIIRVENLSKQYRIGRRPHERTLRETMSDMASAPFRRLGSVLRSPNGRNGNDDDTIWALEDVSFEVMPGEVVGIIGRNGAGKSTLLKILSRITEPTSGGIDLHGRVGSLLEVGTGFHPELTGRENIYLNGAILGMRRAEIERKFDEMVAFAEIEKFLDTPVKHYSSGMYVRLAFAVAAHLEPEILIIDEVLAVGDTAFQKKCLGKMEDVAKMGRTVIFVSHNIAAIRGLCTDCILLETGGLRAEGDPSAIVQKYLGLLDYDDHHSTIRTKGDGCGLHLRALDKEGQPTRVWKPGEELTLRVEVAAPVTINHPKIDIACYSGDRTRLFALQSDRIGAGPQSIKGKWAVDFRVRNPGLTVPEIFFDVGLRAGRGGYVVVVTDAGWLFSGNVSIDGDSALDAVLFLPAEHDWKPIMQS